MNISVSITRSLLLTGTFYLLHEKEGLTNLTHDRLPCLPMSFPNGTHNIFSDMYLFIITTTTTTTRFKLLRLCSEY